jgi:hypothetical protein
MTDPVTDVYNFTGGWQRFNVPGPVSIVQVAVYGAGSGAVPGGRLIGKLKVKGSDVLYFLVGEHGHSSGGQGGGGATTGGGGAGGSGGSPSRQGGGSGGGASEIRLNSSDGELLCISGGAGGTSGDGGPGGLGGGGKGGDGNRAGGANVNTATGGTQGKGGNGGTTPLGDFNGNNASDNISGRGGAGGHSSNDKCHGGGGGGGGYHAGGGGQAGKNSVFFGGGGGGGSSWDGKLYDLSANDKVGLTGHGRIEITYDPDGDPAPLTPTNVTINGDPETSEMATRAFSVNISATVKDTTSGATWVTGNDVHSYVLLSAYGDPGDPQLDSRIISRSIYSGTGVDATGGTSHVIAGGLQANTLYYGRVYAQDKRGQFSVGWQPIKFWTDRPPNPPLRVSPADDTEFDSTDTLAFEWTPSDPDAESGHPETQANAVFQYRLAAGPAIGGGGGAVTPPGEWVSIPVAGAANTLSFPAANLTPGRWYEWRVATEDPHGLWGAYSDSGNFFVNAIALPPTLVAPISDGAIYAAEDNVFEWTFNTQLSDETQVTADLRYRTVGTDDTSWQEIDGDIVAPGSGPRWLIDAETFVEGTHYEWQARTHTSSSTLSAWSASGYFYAVRLPGLIDDLTPIDVTRMQEALGQYDNRVYVYRRGGKVPVGEIRPINDIQWSASATTSAPA